MIWTVEHDRWIAKYCEGLSDTTNPENYSGNNDDAIRAARCWQKQEPFHRFVHITIGRIVVVETNDLSGAGVRHTARGDEVALTVVTALYRASGGAG